MGIYKLDSFNILSFTLDLEIFKWLRISLPRCQCWQCRTCTNVTAFVQLKRPTFCVRVLQGALWVSWPLLTTQSRLLSLLMCSFTPRRFQQIDTSWNHFKKMTVKPAPWWETPSMMGFILVGITNTFLPVYCYCFYPPLYNKDKTQAWIWTSFYRRIRRLPRLTTPSCRPGHRHRQVNISHTHYWITWVSLHYILLSYTGAWDCF